MPDEDLSELDDEERAFRRAEEQRDQEQDKADDDGISPEAVRDEEDSEL
jgi:hypothetical protein